MTWQTLLTADVLVVKSFIYELHNNQGMGYNTIGLYLSGLRRFYDEIINIGFPLNENIFNSSKVRLPRGARRATNHAEALTDDQVRTLLSIPDNKGRRGSRDLAILSTLFGAGIRRGELLSIRPRDLVQKGGHYRLIIYNTKNKPRREIVLAEWVVGALNDWIRMEEIKADDRIFDLCAASVWKILRSYTRTLDISGAISSHSGRATVATKLWNENVAPAGIQEHLGHASIRTTEGYVRGRASNRSVGSLINY